jgi:hypothetical protein
MARSLEDRARAAVIREWAAENGFDVASRGNLPAGVVAAWEAAAGGDGEGQAPGDDGDAPDWAAGAASVGAVPVARPAAPEPEPEARERPVTTLDEARERAGGDRSRQPPGWAKRGPRSRPARQSPPKVTAATVSDIEGKLALMLAVPAAAWKSADPVCGGAFADQLDPIVRAAVPLICQSSDLVGFFTKSTSFLLWLNLAVALQPVGAAIYRHHIAAPEEEGQDQEPGAGGGWEFPDRMAAAG